MADANRPFGMYLIVAALVALCAYGLGLTLAHAAILFIITTGLLYVTVRRPARCAPCVVWFTGLSGSGKSTIADEVALRLAKRGIPAQRLDGDAVREVFPATGFDADSRNKHVRQMGFVSSLLEAQGTVVLATFVSPYQESRDFARSQCSRFIEVHIATSLEECEKRDVKGLYKKARDGEIQNFTGISDPYEAPESPELRLETAGASVAQCAEAVIKKIVA